MLHFVLETTINKIIMLSVSSALTAMAGQASASGFQLQEQNASGLGNAYAGQAAAAENASTIFFNPAGMTRLPAGNADQMKTLMA